MNSRNGATEWVVVCDGKKALLLENAGTPVQPKLSTREVFEQEDAKTSDLGTDRPGRSFQSVGSRRSAMEQTDWHDQAEDRFLADIAARLDQALNDGETNSLLVIAPPRALGVLRKSLSPNTRERVRAEIAKDLVKMPLPEIERHLAA